ncbi:LysR family transcriptional regulator [Algihabitans albus]|uniref:LysR family transcriptional regulator n=1 Tax=Algihabitans albus TaxID=2164067 RepID=UPI0013C2B839|nr:LysR family transcriptional regulator [Algihabitans albus]
MAAFALSNYDLRHLRIFLAVVEHGGVSAAAYRLGASLSTVSRDLSALEKRIGIQLCRRGRSGFSLTPQGEDVHRAAIRLFSELQSFEQTIQSTRQTLGGGFNLGVIDNVVTNPDAGVVAALAQMHRVFPDMLINVSVHTDPMIDVQVRERRIDVGVTGQPEWLAPLEYKPAFFEQHRLYMSRQSPYLKATRAALASSQSGKEASVPYISRDYRTDVFQEFERRYDLQVAGRGSNLESILAAVLAGVGCALLPVHFVKSAETDGLVEIPTPHTPLRVQFYFVYRRDATNRRAIVALLDRFGG